MELERPWGEASSPTYRQVGEKFVEEIAIDNDLLRDLPPPDHAQVTQLWTKFREKEFKLPKRTESEAQKFQPILEALWRHCATRELKVQGNKSAIDDHYRPNIMVLPTYESRAEFRTLVTGCEGKTNLRDPGLWKEAFGQLMTYVAKTREHQINQKRQFMYVALCDLQRIVIVKLALTASPKSATRTDFLPLLLKRRIVWPAPTEGFTALVRLLHASMAQLGYSGSGLIPLHRQAYSYSGCTHCKGWPLVCVRCHVPGSKSCCEGRQ